MAYDCPSDPRRARIAKTLETFGDRVQYSVFVVDVRPAKLVRLRAALRGLMVIEEDSVLIADLGLLSATHDRRFEFLVRRREPLGTGPIVL